jgi:F-type H+/Na+-transporting ATPase subunit alpha
MKGVAGRLKLELSQYRELAAFAQFGSDLDRATQQRLDRGRRMTEVLKQGQYVPLSLEKEVTIIFAGINGYLDDVPVDKVQDFEQAFHRYMEASHPEIGKKIATEKAVSPDIEKDLRAAIDEFKRSQTF